MFIVRLKMNFNITFIPHFSSTSIQTVYLSKSERILWEKERPSRRDQEGLCLTPIDEVASMEFENFDVSSLL